MENTILMPPWGKRLRDEVVIVKPEDRYVDPLKKILKNRKTFDVHT